MVHTNKHAIIIGDQKQLGPCSVVQELTATNINRSFYVRMLAMGAYPVQLNMQYRMHPGLLEFPNKTFYDSRIKSGITDGDRALVSKRPKRVLSALMKPQYPCCCFNVNGRENMQTISKSWENMDEVNIVLMDVRQLMFEYGMKARDIGIITPYSAQQTLLMKEMTKVDENIEINSVDAFQGREKEVIIFSSVRSNTANNIGFL